MLKSLYGEIVRHVGAGIRRFPWVTIATVLIWVCLVAAAHSDDSQYEKHITSLGAGLAWSAALTMAFQLASERRRKNCPPRRPLIHSLIQISIGVVATCVIGCFWFKFGDSPRWNDFWRMIYLGGLIALVCGAATLLYTRKNSRAIAPTLVQGALISSACSTILIFAVALCVTAFSALILKVDHRIYLDCILFFQIVAAPVIWVGFIPHASDDSPDPSSNFDKLFAILLPCALTLLAILYMYIAKIVITRTMPSGTMNWFASITIAIYLFFWFCVRGSRITFAARIVRWGWAALVPVIAVQIVGIVIRHNAYGLTTPRMAGMVTLGIGIYALIIAALDRSPRSIFVVCAIAGLVFTVSPLNIIDIPLREQSRAFAKLMAQRDKIADAPAEQQERLLSAWMVITKKDHSSRFAPVTGIYYSTAKAIAPVLTELKDRNLEDILQLKVHCEYYGSGRIRRTRRNTENKFFHFDCHLEKNSECEIATGTKCALFQTRVKFIPNDKWQLRLANGTTYDVTEQMNALVTATSNRSSANKSLSPEKMLWSLDNNLKLLVLESYGGVQRDAKNEQSVYLEALIIRQN